MLHILHKPDQTESSKKNSGPGLKLTIIRVKCFLKPNLCASVLWKLNHSF